MITVDTLVLGLGLELAYAAGEAGGGRPLTWAHVVDIPDPWNWIGRGELILTTGGGIPAPADQSAWIDAVIGSGAGGLLVAPRPGAEPLGAAALARADAAGFPILTASFDAKFTAIAREVINASLERESRRLASAQRAFTLYAASLARDESPGERLAGLARALGLEFAVLDGASGARILGTGSVGAGGGAGSGAGSDGESVTGTGSGIDGAGDPAEAAALGPWPGSAPAPRLAVAAANGEPIEPSLRQGFATIATIELTRGLAERRALLRAAGALAREWAAGRLPRERLAELLPAAGDGSGARAGAGSQSGPGSGSGAETGSESEPGSRSGSGAEPRSGLRFAVLPGAATRDDLRERLVQLAAWSEPRAAFAHEGHLVVVEAAAGEELSAVLPGEPMGLGPRADADGRTPAEALRLAVLAAERASAERPVVRADEALIDELLLPATPARRAAVAEGLLGPLRDHDAAHGTALLPTLRAYYAHDRSPNGTAAALGVHRHTLGNRLQAIERLTGLHPASTPAIAKLWIALEAERLGDWPATHPH